MDHLSGQPPGQRCHMLPSGRIRPPHAVAGAQGPQGGPDLPERARRLDRTSTACSWRGAQQQVLHELSLLVHWQHIQQWISPICWLPGCLLVHVAGGLQRCDKDLLPCQRHSSGQLPDAQRCIADVLRLHALLNFNAGRLCCKGGRQSALIWPLMSALTASEAGRQGSRQGAHEGSEERALLSNAESAQAADDCRCVLRCCRRVARHCRRQASDDDVNMWRYGVLICQDDVARSGAPVHYKASQ